MTTSSRERSHLPDASDPPTAASLEQENAQLRRAIDSHAAVDQAIGVLIAVHRIVPDAGFEVLREVSQHTNVKLLAVAGSVIGWALGRQPLPEPVRQELEAAVQRHARLDDTSGPDSPH
ncbi:ANTAR domain-containing protein [Streptomyces sp. AK04-3B]|uniref:ANTAR domain-containing protein n=1 Tax=unclassified Streptomyces TaxID=2593676 RepID=UPI0029A7A8C7|nr:ANTAR domain-containing protein [Streptomyces sp. AK04-3B]MDX3799149.1 ANTAR domain-containing protein [Streptomyces sp. AK04-3B]